MTQLDNFLPTDRDYDANVSLSYDYIEKSLKEVQDINNNINTQLGLLIGFDFTFMRFFINELPGKININNSSLSCNSCFLFKILAYCFSIGSIILCFFGLYKTVKYYIIRTNLLIENCDRVSNQELRLAIIDRWQHKLKDFEKLNKLKKKLFNYSILLLVISGLFAVMDYAIAFFFG